MKNLKFITAALVLGITQFSNAQTETTTSSTSDISFGVKGGVNFATITGDDFESPDSRTSFHVGVLLELPITDMFSLQAEALYSGQGFEFEGLGGDKVEYQLDYVNVPVLAKIYITNGFSLEVGPQVSFKVNEEFDNDPDNDPGDFDLDEAESVDFALAGGLTFKTDMGLFATGRYTYGLTDIIKDVDAKNTVFQIGIGYKF